MRLMSVIIPTHNRKASLQRLLDSLSATTFPCDDLEVIVVANGCTDGTMDALQAEDHPFRLLVIEMDRANAAAARNKGAAAAQGKQLVFLDDDIEPMPGMLEAFASAMRNERSVVMGRLLMWPEPGDTMDRIMLVQWWDKKYENMAAPRHHFTHEDLLSGCFSVSYHLFMEAGGFDEKLLCREDYELGIRLLRAGARFMLARDAMGIHHDRVTDRRRGYQRKMMEGLADVDIHALHPCYSRTARIGSIDTEGLAASVVYRWPLRTDFVVNGLDRLASLMLRMKMRRRFLKVSQLLQDIWYLRGVRKKLDRLSQIQRLNDVPAQQQQAFSGGRANATTVKVIAFDLLKDHDVDLGGSYGLCSVLVRAGRMPLWWIGLDGSRGLIRTVDVHHACREKNSRPLMKELVRRRLFSSPAHGHYEPVTVVVCTRNRSVLLHRCLQAILKLEYPRYEVIVVDNAPEDDSTRKVAESAGVRYVLESRPGLDNARNTGIRAASYACIAFTDDDAVVDPLWLEGIDEAFRDPAIDVVTGFVAPLTLETPAQRKFEWNYGGMSHGFSRIEFNGRTMNARQRLMANGCGVGANMAFRKKVFDVVGGFDRCLDVGTASGGGGDVEMFHRVLSAGLRLVYDPSVMVWHEHRGTMKALRRQVFNNGMSFGCYLMASVRKGSVDRGQALSFFLKDWLWGWVISKMLDRRSGVSRLLLLTELRGMASSPRAYRCTYGNNNYEG